MVDRGIGGRRGRRRAARLDDLGAALADARDVLALVPRLVDEVGDFARGKIDATVKELCDERAAVGELGLI